MSETLIVEPLLDLSHIALLRDALGEEDLGVMLAEFSSAAGHALCGIQTAVACNDLEEVRRRAHAFKGVAGSFGAARLAAFAAELELEAPSIASIMQRLPDLADAIEETLAALPGVERVPTLKA